MFTAEDIIGDIVFISFKEKEFLAKLAIPEQITHFKILGHDGLGLWLEHPKLTFRYTTDKNGKSIPKEEQKTEDVDAIFLAPWPAVNTIMHYPNREGFDFPSEFEKHIGFVYNEDKTD